MSYIIGIDIGGSSTKIIGFGEGRLVEPLFVKATDPVSSLYGAFGKFTAERGIRLSEIEKIMVTGVGSSFITSKIYGVSTARAQEFASTGLGGLYLTDLDKAIVVSMGTGTAYVIAEGKETMHLGGTGVGGGTLLGLSSRMLQIRDIEDIIETAAGGDLDKVDLFIKDITSENISTLTPNATASNFGKLSDLATKADLALGLINMVFQTIGMMAVFNAKRCNVEKVVLTGSMCRLPQTREIFKSLSEVANTEFVMPEYAEFATAAGAALCYMQGNEICEI